MKRLSQAPEWMTLVLLLVAMVIGSQISPVFLDLRYLLDKASVVAPVALTALAMTFVIVSGNIDLSVASGTVLASVGAAKVFEAGLPMPFVIPLALLFGVVLGAINGLLITRLKLPSLVVTLGTMALYQGLAQVWVGELTIKGFPDWFVGVDYIRLGGFLPVPFLLILLLAGAGAFLLRRTVFGRTVIALGANESATRYSGINTDRLKVKVFALSGLAMGAAALFLMSEIQAVDYKQLRGGELLSITAVVLGGTSIYGGKGTVWGTFLAILLLVVVRSAMGVVNLQAEVQIAVIGTLLILSVLLSNWVMNLSQRSKRALEQ